MEKNFHTLSVKQTISELKTSIEGLTENEAKKRLGAEGKNELPKEKPLSVFSLLLKQFQNSVIYILFVAAIVSFFTGHFFDGFFILIIISISTVIGFIQEKKADDAIAKLRNMIVYEIEIIRGGKKRIVFASEIVRGDIIVLKQGDKIPADARVIGVNNLETGEAALTGEPIPETKQVEKIDSGIPLSERVNMIYAGTVVVRGEGMAIVTATATDTELGKITSLVRDTEDSDSPLQKKIKNFSKNLGLALIFLNILIFIFGIISGRNLYEMFLTLVAVVVAAIPEGLLPALVVILAIGMQKILKKNGLVKKLMAAETLGSVSVICTDKTGTLTQGEMMVERIVTEDSIIKVGSRELKDIIFKNESPNHYLVLKAGMLCNNVFIENFQDKTKKPIIRGTSTEKALYLAAFGAGLVKEEIEKNEKRLAEIPFDSDYKYMATLHYASKAKDSGEFISYIKGAPERIIDIASSVRVKNKAVKLSANYKEKITDQYLDLTAKGLRVIALGYKEFASNSAASKGFKENFSDEKSFHFEHEHIKGLTLIGFIALADPLRPDAKQSIQECLRAGIKPIIITGDHKLTAKTIGGNLGLKINSENILEGVDLDKISDDELNDRLKDINVYARVEPRHKIRIVKLWQKRGEVVAMTGDGVNDSPAIKAADIGIALGSGTDIAKETADLILLNDSFKIIVEAVKRGRIIFNNIKKVILYLLTGSFTEMVLIGGSVLMGLPLAVLPAQILWIKIIEDTTPAMALAFDEVDEDIMDSKYHRNGNDLLNKKTLALIAFYAAIMDLSLLALFKYYYTITGDIDYSRTITFVGLGVASLFYIYSVRGLKKSIFKINFFSNKFLTFSTMLGVILFMAAIYTPFLNNILKTVPLSFNDWKILLAYGLMGVVVYEIGKKIFRQT